MTEKRDVQELVQVLDRHGKPTGEILPLSKVHEEQRWHEAVVTVIQDTRRRILAVMPGDSEKLHTPGGHRKVVKSKIRRKRKPESQKRTAQREVKEEVRLQIPRENMKVIDSGKPMVSSLRFRPEKNAAPGEEAPLKEIELEHRRFLTVIRATLDRPLNRQDIQLAVDKGEVGRARLIPESTLKDMIEREDASEIFSRSFLHALQIHFLRAAQEKEQASVQRDVRKKTKRALAA